MKEIVRFGLEAATVDSNKFYICLYTNEYVYKSVNRGFDTKQEAEDYMKEQIGKAERNGTSKSTPACVKAGSRRYVGLGGRVKVLKGSELVSEQAKLEPKHKEWQRRKYANESMYSIVGNESSAEFLRNERKERKYEAFKKTTGAKNIQKAIMQNLSTIGDGEYPTKEMFMRLCIEAWNNR